MSIACTRINNEPLSTRLLGNEKEPNVFNSIFNRINGASFVSPAVLDNWINVAAGRPQTGFHINNLRNKTKHALFVRIQVRTS